MKEGKLVRIEVEIGERIKMEKIKKLIKERINEMFRKEEEWGKGRDILEES